MKKSFLWVSLLMLLSFGLVHQANAYQAHYLPGGKNYISKDNLIYTSADNTLGTKEAFLVKPETDYTLSFELSLISPDFEVELLFYENSIQVGTLYLSETDFDTDEIGGVLMVHHTLQTSFETNYMEIYFYGLEMPSGDLIPDIQLEEGSVATVYEPHIEGSMIDTTSPYFQNSGTIISYVDQPITTAEIQSSLNAYDKVDGDVSTNISVVTDGYTEFMDTLGTYSIVFSVSDASGNESTTTVWVEVVDVLAPVFSDVTEVTVVYPNTKTVEDIILLLSASDNYDGDISSGIELVSDGYTENASLVGDYPMQFKVSDTSGNVTYHDITVHVVDQEAPLISGDETLHIGYNQYYSESSMLGSLTVSDNYDTNVTIVIESNTYKNSHDVLGQYQVVFSATDSSGNRTEKTLTIHVVDEVGPMIYLNLQVIQVYSDTVMTLPDFAQLLTKTNELDDQKDYLITVKYDSYSAHANIPGTYHLKLQFEDEFGDIIDKDLQINVVDQAIDGIIFGQENLDISFIRKHEEIFIYGGISTTFLASNVIWYIIYRKRKI